MNFPAPLLSGRFLKRYKRFFADIETLEGEKLTLHVPNTGSLKGCLIEGTECLYTLSSDPNRKLKGTLHFLKMEKSWIGVNTSLPNQLVKELWEKRPLSHWENFKFVKMEHKINPKTRLDMVLSPSEEHFSGGRNLHFIEVKNVTLAEGSLALFPDAVTSRGQKHLEELIALRRAGHTAEILFVVQRTDCESFSACSAIDPVYAEKLRDAHEAGVRITALPCVIDKKKGVELVNSPLKINLDS
jgi:sugar fermentation stimulation protein A